VKKREMTALNEQIVIGNLRIDAESQKITRGGKSIDIAGLSLRLLQVLADRT
jgi:DNA-binding response OmpR family regulator